MAYSVRTEVLVSESPDVASSADAEAVVKAALESDERIEYAEVKRTGVLFER